MDYLNHLEVREVPTHGSDFSSVNNEKKLKTVSISVWEYFMSIIAYLRSILLRGTLSPAALNRFP
jgi:hypothetical protein